VSCSVISHISYINAEHFKSLCAIPRINVGGKLLTNHLKETISYRYTCQHLSKVILWCFLHLELVSIFVLKAAACDG